MSFILQPFILFVNLYIWIIIIASILSFLPIDPQHPAVVLLRRLTEPLFKFVRQKFPFVVVVGGIDLSPLLIIVGLQLLASILTGNILIATISIISSLIYSYIILVVVAVILSYVNMDPYNPIVQVINRLTHPPLNFIRQKLPFLVISGIDLSPIVLIFGLQAIVSILERIALG